MSKCEELRRENGILQLESRVLRNILDAVLVFSAFLLASIFVVLFTFLGVNFYVSLALAALSGFTYWGYAEITVYLYLVNKLEVVRIELKRNE